MATALCGKAAVLTRLGDIDLPDPEVAMIESAIEDASDAARDYGSPGWTDITAPSPVGRLVALAVARYMRNPDDFVTNRASDEMLGWADRPRIDWFTPDEISRLGRMGRPAVSGFGSIQLVAYTTRAPATDVMVPWGDPPVGELFPIGRQPREGSGIA